MASAIEKWLENAIYSDEVKNLTKSEVVEMIDELRKNGLSLMVNYFQDDVDNGNQSGTWKEEEE